MKEKWQWLDDLTKKEMMHAPIPFKQLLEDSVYYPASGTDGDPVRFLGYLSRSFIYVDYQISLEQLMEEMILQGFKGYEIFASRLVHESEITPKNFIPHEHPTKEDGNPRDWVHIHKPPYAYWTIWQRKEGFGDDHGPSRFSLFNLCGDGVASFDALYYTWKTKPLIMCFIQSDGCSCNWTRFREPGLILHRLAMNNPAGKPDYVVMYACPDICMWPEYPRKAQEFGLFSMYSLSQETQNDEQ